MNRGQQTGASTLSDHPSQLVGREYFCHVCRTEFSVPGGLNEDGDLTCPNCQSDCIEEIEIENHPRDFRPFHVGEEERQEERSNSDASGQQQSQQQRQPGLNSFPDPFGLLNMLGGNMSAGGGGGGINGIQSFGGFFGPEGWQFSSLNNNPMPAVHDGLDFGSLFRMLGGIMQPQNEGIQGFNGSFEDLLQMLMENDPNRYGTPPASEDAIKTLEKIVVTEEHLKLPEFSDCSVCKDVFEVGQNVTKMPCNHVFHDDCLLPWLKEHNSCPVCRYELQTDDEDYENRKKQAQNSSTPIV